MDGQCGHVPESVAKPHSSPRCYRHLFPGKGINIYLRSSSLHLDSDTQVQANLNMVERGN